MMAWFTRLFSKVHTNSQSSPRVLQPDILSTRPERQLKANSAGLWQTFIEIFHCRRLSELEKDLRIERESRLLLQGQVTQARSEIDRVGEMLAESLRNERQVYQGGINIEMQKRHGVVFFPDAPKIQDDLYSDKMPVQIEPDYVTARNLQAQANEKFYAKARELRETRAKG